MNAKLPTIDSQSRRMVYWNKPPAEVIEHFHTADQEGLSPTEAKERLDHYGPNRLRETERTSSWQILVEQFKSLIILLLALSAVFSFLFGRLEDGIAVVAVILINAGIGYATELRAVRSMEALKELGSVEAKVLRAGDVFEIEAERLVPGDIMVVEAGDVITADVRLSESSRLQANESALTGESTPVSKQVDVIDREAVLADRSNMLFKGTAVTRGTGKGVVVATGMDTELGQIATLVAEAEQEVTPLEQRLDRLGQRLVWLTLGIIAVIAAAGIIQGKDWLLMIETAIALAVAAVPEGLPIVATIALARGMIRMAKNNALINHLEAVETLGSTTVICTDKTGTLTENQMTVKRFELARGTIKVGGEGLETEGDFYEGEENIDPRESTVLRGAIEAGVLCNHASFNDEENTVGEPLEIALLVAGSKAGVDREELLQDLPEKRRVAFDPKTKMMATYHQENGGYRVAVKGAPEAVLQICGEVNTDNGLMRLSETDKQKWIDRNQELAQQGMRILAVAQKNSDSLESEPYQDLVLLGLIGMADPAREDVRQAIEKCKQAGIRVIMVTGDQALTAQNIGIAVGLADEGTQVVMGGELKAPDQLDDEERQAILKAAIFARVSPQQKLDLIAIHQEANQIVAMTGDGVNDAPALKKADIGVAMGQRGTAVAKQAADMVLLDDAFSTIVLAIQQGRAIFTNIRRFVVYLLSCNISEILVVFIASLINAPLPILPLQILFLNLVTDVFPALALGVGEGSKLVMKQKPRDPSEPVLKRENWLSIGVFGLTITIAVLGAFGLAARGLGLDREGTVTISFLTLAFAQLWHLFNMRDRGSSLLRNDVVQNPFAWGAIALSIGLILAAVYIPLFADLLQIQAPDLAGWALVIGMSLIPLVIGQILKSLPIKALGKI